MEFDLTKMAKKAIQNVVNNTLYRGKPIKDWINFIANNADDLISRQAAIDSLLEAFYDLDEYDFVDKVFIEEELKRVPSVQAVQKTGHWFDVGSLSCRCSECGCKNNKESNYCPECGTYMKGESNDETASN